METIHKIGRRKSSVARVYLSKGKGKVIVNKREVKEYFPAVLVYKVHQPFVLTGTEKKYDVKVNVEGGGVTGQVEAVRLALSRALVALDENHKTLLKSSGLLTRDAREVERKKYGQKKARKKFQFSKR